MPADQATSGDAPDVVVEVIQEEVESLRGLKGIMVLVQHLGTEIEQLGLKKAQIQTEVEGQLRKAGIEVAPRAKVHTEFASPNLNVTMRAYVDSPKAQVLYDIGISFKQTVKLLVEDDRYYMASTWNSNAFGLAGPLIIVSKLRGTVRALVEEFIADYLKVNPTKPRKQRHRRQPKQ